MVGFCWPLHIFPYRVTSASREPILIGWRPWLLKCKLGRSRLVMWLLWQARLLCRFCLSPLEQNIPHLISHAHLSFSIVPCTLILVRNVRKSFLANPKRSKHFACVFDAHKLWVGLFIGAAWALRPSIPNVKDLEYWSEVAAIPMKEIESVAMMYVVLRSSVWLSG